MPELQGFYWDWAEFIARNNNDLVATWGNLVNRTLSLAYKHWDGFVPDPGELRPADQEIIKLLKVVSKPLASTWKLCAYVRLSVRPCVSASEVNKYLDTASPWFEIKADKAAAAKTIYTALRVIDSLKILFAPFIPFSSERLNSYLGYTQPIFGEQYVEEQHDKLGMHNTLRYRPAQPGGCWEPSILQPGQRLETPAPLFKKLEPDLAEEERSRLGNKKID